jgi:hypothetical protein
MNKETHRKAEREAAKRMRAFEREHQQARHVTDAIPPLREARETYSRDPGRREGPRDRLR